ncbi:iron(III) transport system substrate-binding protein [Nonomuraea solani]|uniref:Iron(III) transport system substrate-binding protein n=1 Tax=Nonomuraea solani TaxID=1144553 RepID=A0A1H5W8T9_9ACTN|nr:ABC transporter substrate-binding protein [Nonomuraea solani]SEF95217.1 iron(III) transport system substrate-binding protein [Nonomuraea solani]
MRPLVIALVAVLVAAGCSAPRRDKITVACGAGERWCALMVKRFSDATGVEADFVRLSSGEALERIKAAKTRQEFDVWHGGPADSYVAAKSQGLLEPYKSEKAGEIRLGWADREHAWSGIYAGVLAFCNNTKELAKRGMNPIGSWQELLDERLKGGVAIAHPATSGTAYTALWTSVELSHGDQDAALRYMRDLHPNVLRYNSSGSAAALQAAKEEAAVGVVFSHDCVAAQEQGYPNLQVTFPREGTGYELGGLAVLAGAHNPGSARKYVDWALSGASQRLGPLAKFYALPTNTGVPAHSKAADPATVKLVTYDVEVAGRAKQALVGRFGAEVAKPPS